MTDVTPKSLQIMVKFRRAIQGTLSALLEMHRGYSNEIVQEIDDKWKGNSEISLSGLLTGAAFSLWRAAFLFYETDQPARTPKKLMCKQTKILMKLAVENAANFSTETSTREWMVGFHINNARYRIDQICNHPNLDIEALTERTTYGEENLANEWKELHNKFLEILRFYKNKLHQKLLDQDVRKANVINQNVEYYLSKKYY